MHLRPLSSWQQFALLVPLVGVAGWLFWSLSAWKKADVVGQLAFLVVAALLVVAARSTWKRRILIVSGLLCAYLTSYGILSFLGGYRFSQTGRVRYTFGLSVSDVSLWCPRCVYWEPFRDIGGKQTHRATTLGWFYSPW